MNILYVNKVSPRLGGGVELRILEIGQRLAARGHSVHVICGTTKAGLPDNENLGGVHVHYLHLLPESMFRFKRLSFYLSRYLFYPFSLFLRAKIEAIAPDVIVDVSAPSPSFVYWIARRLGIPCCLEVMEHNPARRIVLRKGLGAIPRLIFSRVLLHGVQYDQIIAISEFTKQNLIQGGFAEQDIRIVSCGISYDKYLTAADLQREDNSLILVGRLVQQKGHRYLFEALVHIREQIPDVRLYVVGDGPLQNSLVQLVRQKGLEQHVVFTGRVEEEDKVDLLHRASLFVNPSLSEGFGIVMLEAMASGLPIVAFDLPVFREFVDPECGYLVPKTDTRAMAERVVDLLRDRTTRQQMSAYNMNHARMYGWHRVTDQAERVLRDVDVNRALDQRAAAAKGKRV